MTSRNGKKIACEVVGPPVFSAQFALTPQLLCYKIIEYDESIGYNYNY